MHPDSAQDARTAPTVELRDDGSGFAGKGCADAFRLAALQLITRHKDDSLRISQQLHDDVAQMLSAAGLQLDILRMDLEETAPAPAGRAADIQAILETVVQKVRVICQQLCPVNVERFGLRVALDWLVGAKRCAFDGNLRLLFDSSVTLPPETGAALFRIAELALDNAVRHSRASQIEVIVKQGRGGPCLQVRDDGTGLSFPSARSQSSGIGLALMEYLASEARLQMSIFREKETWTVVEVKVHSESGF